MDPDTHCDLSENMSMVIELAWYLDCLPVQTLPSPVNPGGQEQVKLPSVLTHIAMEAHGLFAHSLISVEIVLV